MRKPIFVRAFLLISFAIPLTFLNGCGGGGGGGGSSTPATPRPSATPTAGARSLVVQLRDSSGLPVDGIVTVGGVVQATQLGQTFFRSVAAGSVTVSAEVNGITTTGRATIPASGSVNFVLAIGIAVTPGPTSTVPPPPF